MSEVPFIHLHCHTDYSLLDGACEIGQLMAKGVRPVTSGRPFATCWSTSASDSGEGRVAATGLAMAGRLERTHAAYFGLLNVLPN